MSAQIKGWCPSAHRPMMSGDGLLVRVRPRKARLTAASVQTLCDLAQTFGNSMIDVTSRANLQIRGVDEGAYPKLLDALIAAGLVDADPEAEAGRIVSTTPFWRAGDLTDRLATRLQATALPRLPDKMGVVIDTGPAPILSATSGDFRFEASADGALILRADGAELGWPIKEVNAAAALSEMADWFLKTGGTQNGRMARHLKTAALPPEWQTTPPKPPKRPPKPGATDDGYLYGVPFGQTDAAALQGLMTTTNAHHIRVTPWRMLLVEGAQTTEIRGFLNRPDPLLDVAACPGAPACAQATVPTRDLARLLASRTEGTLHVSGCTKGCARRAPADTTLVGRNGRFDLVQDGTAADTPDHTGLTQADILERIG